ncbi:MAG: nicotinate-nucleotide--dimethylbenzimidazole phosphoribosyltransferase [Alphaproteobacteria bacterium]
MQPLPTLASLDDVRVLIERLPGPDREAAARTEDREAQLTKPPGSLGRLEELAAWMAAWQGAYPPRADAVATYVFAGNHGVVERGVSAYPAEVTAQMVANFAAGGAAINQISTAVGARLEVVALELERPTADLVAGPAMSEDDCLRALAKGMTAAQAGADLLCLGEMGIGNTTAAAALACGLFGGSATGWVGPGAGLDDDGLRRKTAVVKAAMAAHRGRLDDPLEALRLLGGRELAAITGAVLGARLNRIPVILDGYVVTAAAAVLEVARAGALDHCRLGHLSAEPGHPRLAERLGLRPLLDLHMRLGEGTGATLAAAIVKAAVFTHRRMATFAEAGVSGRDG